MPGREEPANRPSGDQGPEHWARLAAFCGVHMARRFGLSRSAGGAGNFLRRAGGPALERDHLVTFFQRLLAPLRRDRRAGASVGSEGKATAIADPGSLQRRSTLAIATIVVVHAP